MFFSEIILSYTLSTGSSGTGFSLDDTTSIRYIEIDNYLKAKYREISKFSLFKPELTYLNFAIFLKMPIQIIGIFHEEYKKSYGLKMKIFKFLGIQFFFKALFFIFSFGEDSIRFQCRYSRSVSVSQDMSIIDTPTDAVEGTGDLSYTMSIDVGGPGGTTEVTISPNHNFDEVAPRSVFEKSFVCHNLWLTINAS